MDLTQKSKDLSKQHHWVEGKQKEIEAHAAWHGKISGMYCEALLREHPAFTYLLRTGEEEGHFYMSFVQAPVSFKHQPFVIRFSLNGWFYQNGYTGITPTVDELIPLIMHCSPEQCRPLMKQKQEFGTSFTMS
jgi:hypothetical protein